MFNYRFFCCIDLRVKAVCAALLMLIVCWPSTQAFAQDQEQMEAAESAASPERKEEQLRFAIWEFVLEGAELLTRLQLEAAVTPYLGEGKTLDDVEAAAEAIEQAYKRSGYPAIFVDIPPQDVVAGQIRLVVTEGTVGRVTVKGADYFSPDEIRDRIPSARAGEPFAVRDIRDEIQSVNRLSGDFRVTPIIKSGRRPGEVDIDLKVKDVAPVSASLEYNNLYSPNTTETRLKGSLGYRNLWQRRHNFSLTMQVTPEDLDEQQLVIGNYSIPIGDSRLAFVGVFSDSETLVSGGAEGDALGLAVLSDGEIFGLRYNKPFAKQGDYTHRGILALDYKNFDEIIGEVVGRPIRYMAWSAKYSGRRAREKSVDAFRVAANFGFRGLVNDSREFDRKRAGAEAGYFYLSGAFNRLQRFNDDWALNGELIWHLSDAPLISNEQYSVGGASSVRGYLESQVAGDRGYNIKLDLWIPYRKQFFSDCCRRYFTPTNLSLFYDLAEVFIVEPLPEQFDDISISSVGISSAFTFGQYFNLRWDLAHPLEDYNETTNSGFVNKLSFVARW